MKKKHAKAFMLQLKPWPRPFYSHTHTKSDRRLNKRKAKAIETDWIDLR